MFFLGKWLVSRIASTFKTHVRLFSKNEPAGFDMISVYHHRIRFIGRFYNNGNECNWRNTEQLVFTKPCPQKGFMKTWKYVFQTFQFRLNLNGTKPQFAAIFRYCITEAEIIQNRGRGFRSTLNSAFRVISSLIFHGTGCSTKFFWFYSNKQTLAIRFCRPKL